MKNLILAKMAEQSIDCSATGGANCPSINGIISQENEPLTVEKSTLAITSTTVNSLVNGGDLDITAGFSLENTSSIDIASGTIVSAYNDVNNNGTYDVGDTLLGTKTVTSAITAGNTISDIIDFSTPIARGCNVLLVINTSNNNCICNIAETATICNSDLNLTKVTNNANPDEGDNITFTLTVTNNGTLVPTNIVVKDIIPTDFTYNHPNFTTTQGTATFNALREFVWDLGGFTLPVGDSISLTYTVIVDNCGEFINQVEITNSSLNDPDSTPNNGK